MQRGGDAHVFPTDFDSASNKACSASASPYIANCGYDGAKTALMKFSRRRQGNAAPVTATLFIDNGLAPATQYAWSVAAVDAAGLEGARSAPVSATTTGSAATCTTASNYAHVGAGHARHSGGYALANGSNQSMGLWNMFVTTTLKQTGINYYVIGSFS